MSGDPDKNYEFEDFRLDAVQGLLFRNSEIVDLTPKAINILAELLEARGKVVTKADLLSRVWPDSFVEEANLSHHVFKLRKALGEEKDHKLIETVPKRGYRFVGRIRTPPPPVGGSNELGSSTSGFRRWKLAIVTACLLTASVFGYLYLRRPPVTPSVPTHETIRSIAVMPFINESGNDDVEYLADGITETLIGSLSQIASVGVKPRSVVNRFKGKDVSAAAIGTELNVQSVLFGRITQRGSDLTLYLSLVDPETEFQIWGKQYNRKISELSALQNEVGFDVSRSLEARLTGAEEKKLSKNYSKNAEAYRLYLLGDYYWAKFTEENFWKAKNLYEQAIAIDPEYALAYTGVANTYSVLGVNAHIPVAEARSKSALAAQRAVQLDDHLAEAHLSLGAYNYFFEWDLDAAEHEFKRAMELDPNYAVPHELQAYVLRSRRQFDEAIVEIKRAVELDPLNLLMIGDLGTCYRFAGHPEEAIRINGMAIERDATFADVYFENSLAYSALGDHGTALKQIKKSLEIGGPSSKVTAGLGIIHARAGNNAEAEKVIASLLTNTQKHYVSPLDIALIYSAMNKRDEAFVWLEKAYAERSCWLIELNADPEWQPIRDDPRFSEMAGRIGLNK